MAVSAGASGGVGALFPREVEVPGGPLTVFELADVEGALQEAIATEGEPPYFGVLWDSAVCLAHELPRLPIAGLVALELGCGVGLCSLVAARLGAVAIASDVSASALDAVARAATLARLTVTTQAFDVLSDAPLPRADVVIVADLLYETPLAEGVARRLREAFAAGTRFAVVADPGRAGREPFVEQLAPRPVRFFPRQVGAMRSDVACVYG